MLTDSFARSIDPARTAALHVHAQTCFEGPFTQVAYKSISDFGRALRDRGIPNLWLAYGDAKGVMTTGKLKQHLSTHHQFSSLIEMPDKESGVVNNSASGFEENPDFLDFLTERKIDTLLITGVFYCACVQGTILDGVSHGFRICAVTDATDCPQGKEDKWKKSVLENLVSTTHRARFDIAKTSGILSVLS